VKWIGLTGGIGSGKSTVARIIRDLGFPVIDADQLARDAVSRGSVGVDQIRQQFGPEFLLPDQTLDRKKMAQFVFKNKTDLEKLEKIIHPLVRQLMLQKKQQLDKQQTLLAFYDVPLLFEKHLEKDFDSVVVVSCSEQQQLQRLMARDQLSLVEAQDRIRSQMDLEKKVQRADFVIDNSGLALDLESKIKTLLKTLTIR
jgi:dephospho-CoA kinase